MTSVAEHIDDAILSFLSNSSVMSQYVCFPSCVGFAYYCNCKTTPMSHFDFSAYHVKVALCVEVLQIFFVFCNLGTSLSLYTHWLIAVMSFNSLHDLAL